MDSPGKGHLCLSVRAVFALLQVCLLLTRDFSARLAQRSEQRSAAFHCVLEVHEGSAHPWPLHKSRKNYYHSNSSRDVALFFCSSPFLSYLFSRVPCFRKMNRPPPLAHRVDGAVRGLAVLGQESGEEKRESG